MSKFAQRSYSLNQTTTGIDVGDQVRVLRTAEYGERGWLHAWVDRMNRAVGREFRVEDVYHHSGFELYVDGRYYRFPYFVLEKVNESANPELQSGASQEDESSGEGLAGIVHLSE